MLIHISLEITSGAESSLDLPEFSTWKSFNLEGPSPWKNLLIIWNCTSFDNFPGSMMFQFGDFITHCFQKLITKWS